MIDAEAIFAILIFAAATMAAFIAMKRRRKGIAMAAAVIAVLSLAYAALSILVGHTFSDLSV